ncbi:cardiolipin synthase [Sulfuritortus calidifontis]|uniref:Cardiolipin synthase B n=1 Tax=Sulfuritortus calidifontis TaxID=1914471 RepID=A0A4R3K0L7_9PROT|nr:cardiolipin synthase ClsB [Sulfuritortus calidifontis]TCS74081.1 cardiolipin synthase [Sulfuritortus calidifontis]
MRGVGGNRITLLENGGQYFPALLVAIAAAEQEVHLESYIFEADALGLAVAEALAQAARRGVRVRVLLDGFGARLLPQAIQAMWRAAGVELLFYRPELAPFKLRRHRLRRMHRKLAVIDARLAFVGGINIIDDLNGPAMTAPRYDYAVQVEGPLVARVHQAARHLWQLVQWSRLHVRALQEPWLTPQPGKAGDQRAEFLVRDNLRNRRRIERSYLWAIGHARAEILIANAYFLPGRRFRHALLDAARRGVKVTLLLQGLVEYRLQHYATRALYRQFLEHGIEIYEYRRSYLHAKVAVIDARWATVGSSNIDPFSLLLAREANVVVHDAGFAAELGASLRRAMAEGAHQVHRGDWHRLPWYVRWLHGASLGLVRLLMGWLGYAQRFEAGGRRQRRRAKPVAA